MGATESVNVYTGPNRELLQKDVDLINSVLKDLRSGSRNLNTKKANDGIIYTAEYNDAKGQYKGTEQIYLEYPGCNTLKYMIDTPAYNYTFRQDKDKAYIAHRQNGRDVGTLYRIDTDHRILHSKEKSGYLFDFVPYFTECPSAERIAVGQPVKFPQIVFVAYAIEDSK